MTTKKNSMKKTSNNIKLNDDNFDEFFEKNDMLSDSVDGKLVDLAKRGRPRIGKKFNVTFPDVLIKKIMRAGKKKGVGYQTMIRIICTEKIDEYLNEEESQKHKRKSA